MDQESWRFINTFAPWLSAIGTILAVITSLYLARRSRKIRLRISAGHRLLLLPGAEGEPLEYLVIEIVNIGSRIANINNIGWKLGFLRKQMFVQMIINDNLSSTIPIELKDGEKASYFFPFYDEIQWLDSFAKNLGHFPRIHARSLKVLAHTSIGQSFEAKIESGLRGELIKARRKQLASKTDKPN